MRGRRRTLGSVLAQALAGRPAAADAALAAAVAEACGPRLSREVSCRGVTREGRLLLVASSDAWATELRRLERDLCLRVARRLGRPPAAGVQVHVATPEP
jgi:predicted nucleic acid-binding Zn ribbon protein